MPFHFQSDPQQRVQRWSERGKEACSLSFDYLHFLVAYLSTVSAKQGILDSHYCREADDYYNPCFPLTEPVLSKVWCLMNFGYTALVANELLQRLPLGRKLFSSVGALVGRAVANTANISQDIAEAAQYYCLRRN